jgi:predicted Fe-Mo cluster-binding NifX family protein
LLIGIAEEKEMKIAIPLFETRISPRFDCAPSLLLITTDDKAREIIERNEMVFQNINYIERINQLKTAGVDVVICGGISNEMQELFYRKNIGVIPWVTGDVKKALRLFMQGKLMPGAILCPGRRIRQWGFCTQSQSQRRGKG